MRTIFTENELKAFLLKKINEIEGANILFTTNYRIEEDKVDVPANPAKAIECIFNQGMAAGEIQGQLNFLKDFREFLGM
jgi:hypothetical protein